MGEGAGVFGLRQDCVSDNRGFCRNLWLGVVVLSLFVAAVAADAIPSVSNFRSGSLNFHDPDQKNTLYRVLKKILIGLGLAHHSRWLR